MGTSNPFVLFAIFLIGLILLIRASGLLGSLLGWMARYLKVSEYTAAFILMAGVTSIPELFVGINAAVVGIPQFALGNVLGANLLNVTLVIGITALFGAIVLRNERVTHEAGIIFTLTITPIILFLDGVLSRVDGAVLLFLFFAYLRYLFVSSKVPDAVFNAVEARSATFRMFVKKLFSFLGGIAVLLVASRIVVFAVESGARSFGIPPFLIGFVALSFGTTLPELTFGIRSALNRRGSMGLGNAVGSVVFNLLFILGVVSLIAPISIAGLRQPTFINLGAVTVFTLLLLATLRLVGRIPRSIGVVLILGYAFFVWYLLQFSFA